MTPGRPEIAAAAEQESGRPGMDLRLAVGAAFAWIAAALAAGRAPVTVAGTAVVAALVGAVALGWPAGRFGAVGRVGAPRRVGLLGRAGALGPVVAAVRAGTVGRVVAVAGFCVALVLGPMAGRLAVADNGPLVRLAATRPTVDLVGRLRADPRVLAGSGTSGPPRMTVAVAVTSVTADGRRWSAPGSVTVLAPAAGWSGLLPGQPVRVSGRLGPAFGDPSAVELETFQRPALVGRPPWWQRIAGRVRDGLRRACARLPDGPRGLLPGMVDGDVSGLNPALVQRFRVAGLTHLVAVSGTNCSILVGTVLLLLRRLGTRPAVNAVVAFVVLVAFVVVARPSPSVLRAAVMAGVALGALVLGRPREAMPSLAGATLALLVWDPGLAGNAGFAMSVLATASLLLLAPGWADALERRHVPTMLAGPIAVAAAAHVVTAPIIAALSGRISVIAVPANVLAEPVVSATTVLGFLAAVLALAAPSVAAAVAWIAAWPCRWVVAVGDTLGGLSGASVPWPAGARGAVALAVGTAALLVLGRHRIARRSLAVGGLVALVIQVPVRQVTGAAQWPPPGAVMVVCDVGQGDGIVLLAGPGTAVGIDAGPDPVAIDRCLTQLRIDRVALLILTHFHLDHVGGLAGVVHDRTVGRILTSPLPDPVSGVRLVAAEARTEHIPITVPVVGSTYRVGRVELDVLGPRTVFHDTHSDPNNSSLVVRATTAGTRILLAGDAEIDAQQSLLDAGTDLRADVYKVAHHGSAYFLPAFVDAVAPRLAVISAGRHNDYGLPSPRLLDALAQRSIPVARTDRDGDVAVVRRGAALALVARADATTAAGPTRVTPGEAARPGWSASSVAAVRMGPCPLVSLRSTTCPSPCRTWSCSSVTRSCWSAAPSARSPPWPDGPPRTSPRPS